MSKFLQRLSERFLPPSYVAHDIPALKYNLTDVIATVLRRHNPLLLQDYQLVVMPSAEQLIASRETLADKQAEFQPQILRYQAEQANLNAIIAVAYNPAPPKHKVPKHLRPENSLTDWRVGLVVNISLAFMLALGIAHVMEIQIKSLKPGQGMMLGLAFAVAIGVTVGSKWAITFWVVRTRRTEDMVMFPHQVAFWERLQAGDILSYMSIAIPVGEMIFAAPGLVEIMPTGLDGNPLAYVGTYMVAGLTAAINIFLAWGQAWEKLRLMQERLAERELWEAKEAAYAAALQAQYQQYCQRLEEVSALLSQLQDDLAVQEKTVQIQFNRAKNEYERWRRLLDRWCKRHRRLIEAAAK
jgi:hypothetical protein